uniref:Uncharacterized protein n=1 Tax=Biomphalaria glabrata TaxID=6526 RepID=A0A2C9M1S5_BIOGL
MSSAWFEVQILELLPFHSHSNMADNPAFSFNDEESVNDSKNSVKQLASWSEGGITLHISTELADMSSSASSPDLTNEYEAMHAINSLHTPKSSKAPALAISSQTNNLEADLYQSVTRETNDDSPMQVLAPQSLGETQYLNVPGHNFTTFLPETVEDGCTVISLQVPTLPRAHSAPDLSASATSDDQKLSTSTTDTSSPKKEEKLKMEMTKEELIKTYRLHVFVFLIFVVMVISLSLSWYYKQIANDILLANQNIFFDPATRTLTVLGKSIS